VTPRPICFSGCRDRLSVSSCSGAPRLPRSGDLCRDRGHYPLPHILRDAVQRRGLTNDLLTRHPIPGHPGNGALNFGGDLLILMDTGAVRIFEVVCREFLCRISVCAHDEQSGGEFSCSLWRREENSPHFSFLLGRILLNSPDKRILFSFFSQEKWTYNLFFSVFPLSLRGRQGD
jgi:hypothetical protein